MKAARRREFKERLRTSSVRDDGREPIGSPLYDAVLAGAAFAASPERAGGIIVHADAGPDREAWLHFLLSLLPVDAPVRRFPAHMSDERLLGGLDIAATLALGRPVAMQGVLQAANGGVVIIPSAERLTSALASRIAAVMDSGAVALQRDGFDASMTTRFGIIAFDEGRAPDEHPPSVLLDRTALHITLPNTGTTKMPFEAFSRPAVANAGAASKFVRVSDDALNLLCEMAAALGVHSSNPLLHAVRIARVLAALDGRDEVSEGDVVTTTRLVLAPRATQIPEETVEDEAAQEPAPSDQRPEDTPGDHDDDRHAHEALVAIAKAALPPHLLALLQSGKRRKASKSAAGKSGEARKSPRRGRPVGVRPGQIKGGARLNIVETLRAAAPWQTFRQREPLNTTSAKSRNRIAVRAEDFRVWRLKDRSETVTVFVVDASGSTAVQRLGEAKGAVEILLSECYSRRDHAALISFSGRGSELLLPPTRSVARAKRNLADLPGGGGTPLASGIDAAVELCDAVRRKGQTPSVVMLTDGRANLSRDGKPGRSRAEEDALSAAQTLRGMGVPALIIDTSAKPNAPTARLADAMGAKYLPLAHADAETLSKAVKAQVRSDSP
jgi:magnesium chelatase subunit D